MAATLGYVKYTPVALPLGTIDELLDGIYTMLTSATDWAANTIDEPLTVNREGTTTAVYWSYFAGLSSVRGIIAGDGATNPSMRTPDTSGFAGAYVGCAKGSIGAYGTWATSPVFAGSTFSDYWRGLTLNAGGVLRGWSSAETAWLAVENAAGSVRQIVGWGSLHDTGTTVAPCGESDGTLNGMFVTGTGSNVAAFVLGQSGSTPLDNAGGDGQCHHMAWNGGAVSTAETATRESIMVVAGANVRKNKNNDIALAPPIMTRIQSGVSMDRWIGRVREVYYTFDSLMGATLQVGGVDFAHIVAINSISVSQCYALKAAS